MKRTAIIMCLLSVFLLTACEQSPEEQVVTALYQGAKQLAEGASKSEEVNPVVAYELYQASYDKVEMIFHEYPEAPLAEKIKADEKKIGPVTYTQMNDKLVDHLYAAITAIVAEAKELRSEEPMLAYQKYHQANEYIERLAAQHSESQIYQQLQAGELKIGQSTLTRYQEFFKKEQARKEEYHLAVQQWEEAESLVDQDYSQAYPLYKKGLSQFLTLEEGSSLTSQAIRKDQLLIGGMDDWQAESFLNGETIAHREYTKAIQTLHQVKDAPISQKQLDTYRDSFEEMKYIIEIHDYTRLTALLQKGTATIAGYTFDQLQQATQEKEILWRLVNMFKKWSVDNPSKFHSLEILPPTTSSDSDWYVQSVQDVFTINRGAYRPLFLVNFTKHSDDYGKTGDESKDQNSIIVFTMDGEDASTSHTLEAVWNSESYTGRLLGINVADLDNDNQPNINLLIRRTEGEETVRVLESYNWAAFQTQRVQLDPAIQRFPEGTSGEPLVTEIAIVDLEEDRSTEIAIMGQGTKTYYRYQEGELETIATWTGTDSTTATYDLSTGQGIAIKEFFLKKNVTTIEPLSTNEFLVRFALDEAQLVEEQDLIVNLTDGKVEVLGEMGYRLDFLEVEAFEDVNQDGQQDLILRGNEASGFGYLDITYHIYTLGSDGVELLDQFHGVDTGGPDYAEFTLADQDGDGVDEIIILTSVTKRSGVYYPSSKSIYSWNSTRAMYELSGHINVSKEDL